MKKHLLFLLLLLFAAAECYAQEIVLPIVPDRPDFTNSPDVIQPGFVQIESGIDYSFKKNNILIPSLETYDLGIFGTVIRSGVSENLEIRFGGGYLIRDSKWGGAETNAKGISGLMIGAKYQFLNLPEILPKAAVVIEVGLPFGSSEFKPSKAEPNIYLSLAHDITGHFSVTYNAGAQYRSSDDKFIDFYSLSFGIKAGERMNIFVEHYGLAASGIIPSFYIDAGISYLQSRNIIVDLHFGKGLKNGINEWYAGAGFTLRLPR